MRYIYKLLTVTFLATLAIGCNAPPTVTYRKISITIGEDYYSVHKKLNLEKCTFYKTQGIDELFCSYESYDVRTHLFFKYDKLVGYSSLTSFVEVKDTK